MSLADIKAGAREAIHERMSVAIIWRNGIDTFPVDGVADKAALSARWGNKIVRQGDLGGDYADIFEGVDRLIFQDLQLEAASIVLSRGDLIEFPEYGLTFELDQREQRDGPRNVYWSVSRA